MTDARQTRGPGALCLLVLLAGTWLMGQTPAEQKPAPQKPAEKPAEQKPEAETISVQKPPEITSPSAVIREKLATGTIEFGYRFVPRLAGNENVYRSLVNLGEGPKLFSGFLAFRTPKNRLYDRFEIQASSWGGEPYNTARVDLSRDGGYAFSFNYRRLDYFNDLPSFANPLLALGYPLSQNARDTERRLFDVQLDVLPGRRLSPFFAYSRNAGSGPGLIPFVGPGNEFLSNIRFDDAVNLFRGGTHLTLSTVSLTLEAGGAWFADEQRVFNKTGPNPGNRRTPSFGQTLRLDNADQTYKAEGNTFFTNVYGHWRAASFLDLNGRFSFSQPSLDVAFRETSAGNFVVVNRLLAFSSEQSSAAGQALRPYPSATLGMELRPLRRVRILQSWNTDRFHVSSSGFFTQALAGVRGILGTTPPPTLNLADSAFRVFTSDYNRYQAEGVVDVHPRVTLRGGYRRVWADTVVPPPTLVDPQAPLPGSQRHDVGLGGVEVRARKDLSLHAEAEVSSGEAAYFRTGLLDYQKLKIRGRYYPRPWLSVTGMFALVRNQNDRRDIDLDFRSHETAVSVFFAPQGGRRVTLSLDYMHSVLDSDMLVVLPPFFERGRSAYLQDAHHAGVFCNLALVRGARANFGGTLLVSDGSRPTRFYQPRAELSVPLVRSVEWMSEWRWYGFNEASLGFENFTTHLLALGLRLKF